MLPVGNPQAEAEKKHVISLEANSKVGYVIESVSVRININPFFLKEKALHSSIEIGAKKRRRYKERDVRICYSCVHVSFGLFHRGASSELPLGRMCGVLHKQLRSAHSRHSCSYCAAEPETQTPS